jgi:predicted membrane protein
MAFDTTYADILLTIFTNLIAMAICIMIFYFGLDPIVHLQPNQSPNQSQKNTNKK